MQKLDAVLKHAVPYHCVVGVAGDVSTFFPRCGSSCRRAAFRPCQNMTSVSSRWIGPEWAATISVRHIPIGRRKPGSRRVGISCAQVDGPSPSTSSTVSPRAKPAGAAASARFVLWLRSTAGRKPRTVVPSLTDFRSDEVPLRSTAPCTTAALNPAAGLLAVKNGSKTRRLTSGDMPSVWTARSRNRGTARQRAGLRSRPAGIRQAADARARRTLLVRWSNAARASRELSRVSRICSIWPASAAT